MSTNDRNLQMFSFKAEDLKPILDLAAKGRAQELDNAFRQVKHLMATAMLDSAEQYYTERRWFRLFIRRRKPHMPTVDQVLKLTQEDFNKMYLRSEDARWHLYEPDPVEHMFGRFGNLGVVYHMFGYKARNVWYGVSTTGVKWIREWEALAERLDGPPPSEAVQIAGEILSSMQYYAAEVKPLEA